MKIIDMLVMCFRNLWRRKARTLLTVVGVVIGSCAVIVMISLGLGMNKAMDTMLASWGDLTAVNIYNYRGVDTGSDSPKLDDTAIAQFEAIDDVVCVLPRMYLEGNMVTVAAGKNDRYQMSYAQIYGIDFTLLDKMGYFPEEGSFPKEDEAYHTIIFGNEMPYQFRDTKKRGQSSYTYKQQLPDGSFSKPFIEPLNESIKIGINNTKKPNSQGGYTFGGRGYEYKLNCSAILQQDPQWETPYSIFIDINLAKEIIDSYNRLNGVKNPSKPTYTNVKIVCKDINSVDHVQKAVEELGFQASSMAQVRQQMQGQLGTIQMILGSLAAISLLVAAISITNTMIMSIYERTREIGIMKVLGCYIGNIRVIFLMEAGGIGLLGGIIGTVISYIISAIINSLGGDVLSSFIGYGPETGGEVSIIPIWLVLLALGFSTVVGLISGLYPANRAVKISALEAIKNE